MYITIAGGPGGEDRILIDPGDETLAARSTSCPSMAYSPGASALSQGFRFRSTADDDINLEGEVITDLPVEPTQNFPDLTEQLNNQSIPNKYENDQEGGVLANQNLGYVNLPDHSHDNYIQTNENLDYIASNQRHDYVRANQSQDYIPTNQHQGYNNGNVSYPVYDNYVASKPYMDPVYHFQLHLPARKSGSYPLAEKDCQANVPIQHHKQGSNSSQTAEDKGDYTRIRYRRKAPRETDGGIQIRRTCARQSTSDSGTGPICYPRQNTKDSMGDIEPGNRHRSGGSGTDSTGYNTLGHLGKHKKRWYNLESTPQRHNSSPSFFTPVNDSPQSENAPHRTDKVVHIRDLPSSIAREVIADKAHVTETSFHMDVEEKCIRWLNSLHVATHDC